MIGWDSPRKGGVKYIRVVYRVQGLVDSWTENGAPSCRAHAVGSSQNQKQEKKEKEEKLLEARELRFYFTLSVTTVLLYDL